MFYDPNHAITSWKRDTSGTLTNTRLNSSLLPSLSTDSVQHSISSCTRSASHYAPPQTTPGLKRARTAPPAPTPHGTPQPPNRSLTSNRSDARHLLRRRLSFQNQNSLTPDQLTFLHNRSSPSPPLNPPPASRSRSLPAPRSARTTTPAPASPAPTLLDSDSLGSPPTSPLRTPSPDDRSESPPLDEHMDLTRPDSPLDMAPNPTRPATSTEPPTAPVPPQLPPRPQPPPPPLPPLYMPFTAPSPTPRDQQLPLNRLLPERPTNCPPLHEPPSDLDPTSGSPMVLSQGGQPATIPPDRDAPEMPQAPNFPDYYHAMSRNKKRDWYKRHLKHTQ